MVIGLIVLGFGLVFGGVVVESAMKVEAYQAQQAHFLMKLVQCWRNYTKIVKGKFRAKR